MQVATTVFVGNITDKATDTLVRQVLLVGPSYSYMKQPVMFHTVHSGVAI